VVGTVSYSTFQWMPPLDGSGGAWGHAALWYGSGTSFTFFDLQAAVGANWTTSDAYGVYRDATGIYIVGEADGDAILWHIPADLLPATASASRVNPTELPGHPQF